VVENRSQIKQCLTLQKLDDGWERYLNKKIKFSLRPKLWYTNGRLLDLFSHDRSLWKQKFANE